MDRKELKQKIRKLKKLELFYRYGISLDKNEKALLNVKIENLPLVWNEFFEQSEAGSRNKRYPMLMLQQMDKEQLKQVFDEFWFQVYYCIYEEKGIQMMERLAPELLSYMNLPYDADKTMIKKKYHELCKQYHPDEGGNQEEFIKLLELMEKYDLK